MTHTVLNVFRSEAPRRTLADIIAEKINEKRTEIETVHTDLDSLAGRGAPADIDPRVVEMYEDPKKIYFVNEMCLGGTLYERVAAEQSFSEVKAAKIVRQLLSAVAYLHGQKIVHGDIKPQNLHFSTLSDDMIKLIDFGTSRRINDQHAMHGVFGQSYYNAPEVIEGVYSEKCDVWSIGVIMYILLSGEPPFNAPTDQGVIEQIKVGDYSMEGEQWEHVSDEAKNLLS